MNLFIYSPGEIYENRVNKVLKLDVFKDFAFYEAKNGMINFNLITHYKVDINNIKKKFFAPDFFVHRN